MLNLAFWGCNMLKYSIDILFYIGDDLKRRRFDDLISNATLEEHFFNHVTKLTRLQTKPLFLIKKVTSFAF